MWGGGGGGGGKRAPYSILNKVPADKKLILQTSKWICCGLIV